MHDNWIRIGDDLYNLEYVTDIQFMTDADGSPVAQITLAVHHGTTPRQILVTGFYVDGLREISRKLVPHGIGDPPTDQGYAVGGTPLNADYRPM